MGGEDENDQLHLLGPGSLVLKMKNKAHAVFSNVTYFLQICTSIKRKNAVYDYKPAPKIPTLYPKNGNF